MYIICAWKPELLQHQQRQPAMCWQRLSASSIQWAVVLQHRSRRNCRSPGYSLLRRRPPWNQLIPAESPFVERSPWPAVSARRPVGRPAGWLIQPDSVNPCSPRHVNPFSRPQFTCVYTRPGRSGLDSIRHRELLATRVMYSRSRQSERAGQDICQRSTMDGGGVCGYWATANLD